MSSTTLATVLKDLADLQAKVKKVAAEVKSPQIVGALKADAKVYAAYVEFNLVFLPLIKAVVVDPNPAKIPGIALGILALWKGLPDAIGRLKRAHEDAMKAGKAANPALVQLIKDLLAMQAAGIKLAADTKGLGGV